MPAHDWTRVDAHIFHTLHHGWITDIGRALNGGRLPPGYYALSGQIDGATGADVLNRGMVTAAVVIRHVSNHRIIAVVEVVSPGNKNNRHGLRAFAAKAVAALRAGIHLLIVDLFPPGPRDPQGIHPVIWEELMGESDFALPADAPLTLAAYVGGDNPEAFIEPTRVGAALPDMPLFLTPEVYVPVPLEATYQSTWQALPAFWRDELQGPANGS